MFLLYIRDGKNDEISRLMAEDTFYGMTTMNRSLFALYQAGRIDADTALAHSPAPNEMSQRMRGRV